MYRSPSGMQQTTEYVLPDFFSVTPFAWDGRNALFAPDKRESTEWMLSYGFFTDLKRARLGAAKAELAGAITYPYADAHGLRIVSDFLTILFTLDEITDDQDGERAKATRATFVNALTGESGRDDSPVTMFTKDFMKRLSERASKEVVERFVSHCIAYIDAVTTEARVRENSEVLSIEEYTHLRRHNGGMQCCFDLIEVSLGITLPEVVFEDPSFTQVCLAANDVVCMSNDVYSYAIENASGLETCNAVSIFMKKQGISLQNAVDHIAKLYEDIMHTFMTSKANMRSFDAETDEAIRLYIYALEQWAWGNLVWSFDSERYFGKENEEVKRTGIVKLRQRQ